MPRFKGMLLNFVRDVLRSSIVGGLWRALRVGLIIQAASIPRYLPTVCIFFNFYLKFFEDLTPVYVISVSTV